MSDHIDNNPAAENKMGTMPVGKLIRNMSVPPMISMFVFALYNIVDSIFLGKVSQNALTAVTLVFPVQMFIMSITMGIGVGLSSLISRRLGEKKQAEANSAAAHGFLLAIFVWVFYALFGFFLSGPFLSLFANPADEPEIFAMALIYCRIVTVGSIFSCFSVVIERILQATGNMLYPMIFNITGAVVNSFLAPIFIIGLFGAPALGVAGAGCVAVFGQMISCLIALFLFVRKKHAVRVSFKGFRIRGRMILDILAVGAPSIVMMAVMPVLISGLNAILITYSTAAVAVLGVYYRVNTFIMMPVQGLNQGALPIMGYNFGAKNRLRLMATFKVSLKTSIIIMIIGVALFWLIPGPIMRLFSAEGEMLDMGIHALRTISISFLPAAFVVISIGLFQALAYAAFALVISIVRQIGVILPVAYILAALYGVNAVWYAFPLAEIVAVILAALFFRRLLLKEISVLPDGAPVEGKPLA